MQFCVNYHPHFYARCQVCITNLDQPDDVGMQKGVETSKKRDFGSFSAFKIHFKIKYYKFQQFQSLLGAGKISYQVISKTLSNRYVFWSYKISSDRPPVPTPARLNFVHPVITIVSFRN